MKRDRVYIIPTTYGIIYGLGALLCLLAAAIYSNNLAYLLCFFLISLFVIGMHQSNHNLKKLQLHKVNINLVADHSSGTGTLWLKSENPDGHACLNIKAQNEEEIFSGEIIRIHKNSLSAHRFKFTSGQRGKKNLKKITISSRYPFGLFYVWRNYSTQTSYSVYPKPKGALPLPQGIKDGQNPSKSTSGKGEDFKEHKPYIIGESQKRIDWKAYARGRPLLLKEFEDGSSQHYAFNIKNIKKDFEKKLQQISKWILECEKNQYTFEIDLPSGKLSKGKGSKHKNNAFHLLASQESTDGK